MPELTRTGFSRVFLLEQRAGPETPPQYNGQWRAGALTWDQGDVTVIRVPSDSQYDAFVSAGKIIGEPGNPEIELTALYPLDTKSTFLKLARRGCDNDLQIHFGNCANPQDFNGGWTKILAIDAARPTSWATEELGALETADRAVVHETLPTTGEDAYEIVKLSLARQADIQFTREAMDVAICDSVSCGLCGLPSDGTSRVFALEARTAGSPGANAQIVATQNGGLTWTESTISSLSAAQSARRLSCVGVYVVVASDDSDSLHYALITDVLRGTGAAWTQVATGFVATKGPRDLFSLGASQTWFVGEGGFIYFTTDPTAGVTPQEQGSLTVQNLNAIHGYDSNRLVAVGDGNIVLFTSNGGQTWAAAPGGGPAVGVALNAVFARQRDEWWVGTATGRLFYTRDAGTTWFEKSFPGNASGAVRDIQFPSRQVGYIAHEGATGGGRILRSISGGNSWYVLPEGTGAIPANTRVNTLAATRDDVNVVYGAGLDAGGSDGFLVRGSGV